MLRIPFLALFLLCGLCAADQPLPPAAQKAIDKANADIAKVRAALVKELTRTQDAVTKKGDLEGAMAIKAEIERQTQEMGGAVDLLGNPVDRSVIRPGAIVPGKRYFFRNDAGMDVTLILAADGSFKESHSEWQTYWEIKEGKLIFSSATRIQETVFTSVKIDRNGKRTFVGRCLNGPGEMRYLAEAP